MESKNKQQKPASESISDAGFYMGFGDSLFTLNVNIWEKLHAPSFNKQRISRTIFQPFKRKPCPFFLAGKSMLALGKKKVPSFA